MIYVDSSVLLAEVLSEDVRPDEALWAHDVVTSRLSTYEVWNRLHALAVDAPHQRAVRKLLRGLLFIEMTPAVLERALEPFPIPLRTLEAMHVASIHHLRVHGGEVSLATFDRRMSEAARAMGIPLWEEHPSAE